MSTTFEKFEGVTWALARLLLAHIFIIEGWSKIFSYTAVYDYMASHGIPGALLPLVILTELAGGLCIAFGFASRFCALALAGFCILTALFFHSDIGQAEQLINFQKNIAMAGGFLLLFIVGAGPLSVDARLWPDHRHLCA